MVSIHDTSLFKVFGKAWGNSNLRNKVIKSFSEESFPRLVLLEEKFYAASLCHKRLKNRSKRYGNLRFNQNILANNSLRLLHSDEYFFFTCCNFIYKEVSLLREQKLLLDLPPTLFSKLATLKEERRYHEHGKEWYWGKVPKLGVVSSKGDNFDFDSNMQLLKDIYTFFISKIKD
ncbi:hypothetical protein HY008_00040 [Candidatus Woesebacteria bacterium]|nr:hypothetical protein [Candidatus Woesebacteria bacterium]